MSNISLDLSNKLPGEQVNIVREVVDAADIGRLLTDTSRMIVKRVLSEDTHQRLAEALAMAMVRNNANYYGDYDFALAMLAELRTGISEV